MTPKDNNDLSAKNIGWLRAYENDQISDEDLKEEVNAILNKDTQKIPPSTNSSQKKQSSSLQDTLKNVSHSQELEQTTFDDLLQISPEKPKSSIISRHDLEDQIDSPRIKGNGGWHKRKRRERE